MSNQDNREQVLLHGALKYQSQEARAAYLDASCGKDQPLRQRVEALLLSHTQAQTLREEPLGEMPQLEGVSIPVTGKPGDLIGPYKLLEKLGEGGFGVVYVAEQQEPVKRRVALKIIKLGMDTRSVVARFEAERQALALMNHPHIAKVFDAGATRTGRPYFVMELVKGISITRYCDRNKLATKDRLILFNQVCQAIQHAHQKGIIHRDIKPTNILVCEQDNKPVPKVIDFGIAKATDKNLTENTLYTAFEQFIGTPAYVSPEQAEMSALDVDTRTDIYSLGVLLYELLTGRTPFDTRALMEAGVDEMRRRIREEDPPRPSTRLTTMTQADQVKVAAVHQMDPVKFKSLLGGDLDWIVMKALEKDRGRRYETANGFARDIERHLNNESVVARPPSAGYRLQKFVRRNRLAVGAASLVLIALISGVVLSGIGFLEANQQRDRALDAQKEARGNLYRSLIGQAKATRIARQVGYREQVFDLVGQALDLDTPIKDLSALRHEAVGSMGDFVGFKPRLISTNNIRASMKLSPDRRWLAWGLADGGIELHELASGRAVGPLETGLSFEDVEFNALANRLYSRSPTNVIEFVLDSKGEWRKAGSQSMSNAIGLVAMSNKVFMVLANDPSSRRIDLVECGTWQTTGSFQRSEGPWMPLAFSPDGRKLALRATDEAVNLDYEIEIWDLPGEQRLGVLPSGAPMRLSFNEDSRYVTCLSEQGTLVFDLKNFDVVDTFTGSSDPGNARDYCSFLPGTPLLAVPLPQQRRFLIRDSLKKQTVAVLQEDSETLQALFSPGGEFLLTRSAGGVKLYPFASAQERLALVGHPASVTGIAFDPDGSRLASVSKDRTVKLWDADSGHRIWDGDRLLPKIGQSVAFSPDGRLLATGSSGSPLVQLWNANTGQQVLELTHRDSWTWSLQFMKDHQNRLRLMRSSFGGISIWAINSTAEVLAGKIETIDRIDRQPGGTVLGLVPAPRGQRIAFVTQGFSASAAVAVQDVLGSHPPVRLAQVIAAHSVQQLAFAPDGHSVATLTVDNRIVVSDASTGNLLRTFPVTGQGTKARQIALSAKGRWLAVSTESRRGVAIYDFMGGKRRYTLPEREGTVYWLAWDPSEEPRLAIARDNGDIAIWDLALIDRQLARLGLGFSTEPSASGPGTD